MAGAAGGQRSRRLTPRESLAESLAIYGQRRVDIAPDGHCLFGAFATFKGDGATARQMRTTLAVALRLVPPQLGGVLGYSTLVNSMMP